MCFFMKINENTIKVTLLEIVEGLAEAQLLCLADKGCKPTAVLALCWLQSRIQMINDAQDSSSYCLIICSLQTK